MLEKNSSLAFVKFDRVQKSYDGETLVVKDLNLEVPKGEFLTMLGPSGSGKTTCLMMLAGFETATHGEIMLNGISINNILSKVTKKTKIVFLANPNNPTGTIINKNYLKILKFLL